MLPKKQRLVLSSSGIRLQGRHHPAAVVGDPGLLQELPDIPPLLHEGGGDREQPAAADGAAGRLDLRLLLGKSLILR